jgi:5-methylcytosine-specific restriction enzyme B
VRENYDFFLKFFRRENLEKAEWADVQQLGEHLHCFKRMSLARAKALGNPNHPIEHYRKSLIYVAHGSGNPAERIRRFYNDSEFRLDYFGKSAVSELVGYLFPDHFLFANARDKFAVKFLDINVEKHNGDDFVSELEALSNATRPLAERYLEIVGKQTDLPLNLEVDQFLSWIYENFSDGDEDSEHRERDSAIRYWTFAPGRNGEHWPEFHKDGIIAIGWDETGDLRNLKNKEDIRLKIQELSPKNDDSSKKNDALACWQFANEIKKGDVIFAKKGLSTLAGTELLRGTTSLIRSVRTSSTSAKYGGCGGENGNCRTMQRN